MADVIPLVLKTNGELQRVQSADWVGVAYGGTGANTAAGARTALGVQAYSLDLTNFTALSASTGIPVRTATNTWAMRQVATVSATRITVTNPGGVAGDITLDLATVTDSNTGTFEKVTVDAYGRVTGTTAVVAGDITALVNGTYAPIASPTFTGTVTLPTSTPSAALEAASKGYVDAMVAGQRVQDSVRVATTVNGTLATAYANGQTVDGVVLATNDRILIKDQSTGAENGVYIVTAGAPTRATDFDGNSSTGEVVGGATFWVNEGTAQADTAWTLTNNGAVTVGTTALTFTQSSGLGQVVAGNGMTKTGNTLAVGTASTARIVVNADDIDLATVTDGGTGTFLKFTRDTYGRVTGTVAVAAADITALLDSDLTAIASNATNGIYARTGTGTVAARTITGTAGRVNVTSGDGVAGNPTIDLPTGVNTSGAGTYDSVTVDTYGRVTSGTVGGGASTLVESLTNGEAGAIAIGRAVYSSASGSVRLANANAAGTKEVVGIVAVTSINSAAAGNIAIAGTITATTGEWDAVTGQTGGLTFGAVYFLDNVTAGKITSTAPTSGYVCSIGKALSTTKLALNIGPAIQL